MPCCSDAWLQQHVTAWTAAGADVLITWDEGSDSAGVGGGPGGGQIAALLTGPNVTSGQDSTQYSHYSVLAGIENTYGLPLLANAATANPIPLHTADISSVPVVSIAQPAAGSSVSGTVTVAGTAQAQGSASITHVQVGVDGQAPSRRARRSCRAM